MHTVHCSTAQRNFHYSLHLVVIKGIRALFTIANCYQQRTLVPAQCRSWLQIQIVKNKITDHYNCIVCACVCVNDKKRKLEAGSQMMRFVCLKMIFTNGKCNAIATQTWLLCPCIQRDDQQNSMQFANIWNFDHSLPTDNWTIQINLVVTVLKRSIINHIILNYLFF